MKDNFVKFPSTPHLALLDGVSIRDDKVLSETERNEFMKHRIVVEEKVDGANLGISFDSDGNLRAQNRGMYLQFPAAGQWKKLYAWLSPKIDVLFEHLLDRYVLFGEWCYARHSVSYDRLPDWFVGFDIYDKVTSRFLGRTAPQCLFSKDWRHSCSRGGLWPVYADETVCADGEVKIFGYTGGRALSSTR